MARFTVKVAAEAAIVQGVTRMRGQEIVSTDNAGVALAQVQSTHGLKVYKGYTDEVIPMEELTTELVQARQMEAKVAEDNRAIQKKLADSPPPVSGEAPAPPAEVQKPAPSPIQAVTAPAVEPRLKLKDADQFPPSTVSMKDLVKFAAKYGVSEEELGAQDRDSKAERMGWLKQQFGL